MSKEDSGSIGKMFLRIRHKMTFHYDAKEIMRGYSNHFFNGEKIKEQAFISTGVNMAQSRYYFADAAVQNYINLILDGMEKQKFQQEIIDVMHKISEAFSQLVDRFIQKRGFAYTLYRPTD